MLAAAVVLAVAGVAGFSILSNQEWYVRGAVLALGLGAGVVVALLSMTGKTFIGFAEDSYREVRKVVWPSRKEAGQMYPGSFRFRNGNGHLPVGKRQDHRVCDFFANSRVEII